MHCAKCNNEIDKYIIQWTFETDCAQFADFNFLSSYTEIIEYAKKQECNIYYSADKYDKAINYCEDIVDHTQSFVISSSECAGHECIIEKAFLSSR
jgi:hypothetical protein